MAIRYGDQTKLDLKPADFKAICQQDIRPLNGTVHLQLDHSIKDDGRLIQRVGKHDHDKQSASLAQARILAVGADIDDVEPGDIVLVNQHAHSGEHKFELFADGTALFVREAVVVVVERK